MAHSIKTVYVVHHSHTDIGYTDLQERVIAIQVNYIKTVLSMMRQPEYADFRWNCETLYCVEELWKQASEDDRADFARFVKEGKIGISANYLNFNDLVNADVFGKRLAKWQDKLQPFGTKIHTAMAADVNGFSMGYRDAMIENGVEFFFTNVHCHHGMYPLYQNQNAFFWENASGQRLLVWNGEHYNLGNVLGLQPNHAVNWMMRNRLGEDADAGTSFSDQLHTNGRHCHSILHAGVPAYASASGGAVLFLRGAPRTGSQYSRQTRRNAHRKTDGNHLHGTWSCVHPVASALQPCRYSKS